MQGAATTSARKQLSCAQRHWQACELRATGQLHGRVYRSRIRHRRCCRHRARQRVMVNWGGCSRRHGTKFIRDHRGHPTIFEKSVGNPF